MTDATAEYEPTNAELLNAAVAYVRAQENMSIAQRRMEAVLYDFVREHFPIINNPWHTQTYHAVWDSGLCIGIDVTQTYFDEYGSRSETFRVNLRNEF